MNCSISPAIRRIFRHCSVYSVTGNRPTPYSDTPPFSLTFRLSPRTPLFFSFSFSARNRSISAFRSSSDIGVLLCQSTIKPRNGTERSRQTRWHTSAPFPAALSVICSSYFGLAAELWADPPLLELPDAPLSGAAPPLG